MLQHSLPAILLLFLFTTTTTSSAKKEEGPVELALMRIGGGSAEQLRTRLRPTPIMILDSEHCRKATEALPSSIGSHRISSGKLLQRVLRIIKPVVELHKRTDSVELFLYQGDVPQAKLWMGCLLLISDSLAAQLYDEELAGVVAHELGHSYFMDEMIKAQREKDELMMKTIELECDGVAMLTLKLLGHRPQLFVHGIRRISELRKEAGFEVQLHWRSHPTVVERAQFAARFLRLLES